MSNKFQHLKKNSKRPKAEELGYHSTTQHNYKKVKEVNKNQLKLL